MNVTNSDIHFFSFGKRLRLCINKLPILSWSLEKIFGIIFVLRNRIWEKISKTTCYAFGSHSEESEYCDLQRKHHHLLLESRSKIQKRGKGYAVPCLYTTFLSLIHTTSYLKLSGKTFKKLSRAVTYKSNLDNSPFFRNTKRIYKWVPIVRNRNGRSAQTSDSSPVFLIRLNLRITGQHAALTYMMVDIFITGFGTMNNEMLDFHFDSSCIEKKGFENLLYLAWAKIRRSSKMFQILISFRQRLPVWYNRVETTENIRSNAYTIKSTSNRCRR